MLRWLVVPVLIALAAPPAAGESELQQFLRTVERTAPLAGSWPMAQLGPRRADLCYCPGTDGAGRQNAVGQLIVTQRMGADRLLYLQVLCGVPKFTAPRGDMWGNTLESSCTQFVVLPEPR